MAISERDIVYYRFKMKSSGDLVAKTQSDFGNAGLIRLTGPVEKISKNQWKEEISPVLGRMTVENFETRLSKHRLIVRH